MEFATKTFKITENVSFSILMAYFDGHPICQTKSLKLNYHGQLQEMKSGNRLYESLIPHGLQTKEALDLLNYLSRLIYGDNVYEVYINNSNQSDYVSEMKEYITHNASVSTHGRNNRFDLIEGITNNANQINQEELNKHRNNDDFPLVVHDFKEIEVAPLFTYVHPSLAINQGSTIHLCHFAFLLERLSHLSAYPEFNNQAIMSLLGNVFESDESGLTVEQLTKDKYDEIVEENSKLKEKVKRKQDKISQLIKTVKKQTRELTEQRQQIAYQTSLILQQNGELEETHNDVRDLLDLNMENSRNINDLMRVSKVMKNELKKHNVSNTSTETHKPQLVLFLSASIPGGKYKKIQPEHSIWIGTKCQEFERGIEHYLPDDADILFQSEVVGIDIIKFILDSTADIYIDSFYRQILIQDVNVEEFINRVNNIVIERGNHDAIINLKPITDRIKAREVQQQINERRQRREQQCIELRQRIIDNHYTHINIFGEYRQIYCKDEEGHMTTELDPNKVFYVIRTVGRQRRKERLNIPMMRESEYR